jgi:MFS family permease
MNGLFNFLHNYNFVRVVTFGAIVSAVLLTVLAGSDIKNIGIDQPHQIGDALRQKTDDYPRLREMLIEQGEDEATLASMNYNQIKNEAVKYSRKTSVPHLARLVSGFSSCIFLLMFWFLYQKKRRSQDENEQSEPDDYSMLFFGLAMLTWSLPTEQVFRIYGFESFARALDDSRAFLNSIFFICAYWDMEYKIPERWKSFFSFPIPIWCKRFVEKYSKRGTFVFLTVLLTTVILILFFAGIAHTKIDDNDISWYDYFDFFFSVGFSLLFIVAIIFGFHKRIRYSENDNSIGIGSIMGLFIASGFGVVVLFYAVDNPLGWKPPQPLKDLVETGIFQLIYQFLILFSVSFLAFSGAYEKEMKKANDLKSINIKLKEEQKKLQNANIDLEKQKSELEEKEEIIKTDRLNMLHNAGNSIRRVRNKFEQLSSKEDRLVSKKEAFGIVAMNLDAILILVEKTDPEFFGKEYVPFKKYIIKFLKKINLASKSEFIRFEFEDGISVNDELQVRFFPIQTIGDIIFELSINAHRYGGKVFLLEINQDGKKLTILAKDNGSNFNIQEKIRGNGIGLRIIAGYLKEIDPDYIFQREIGYTYISFNLNKIIQYENFNA